MKSQIEYNVAVHDAVAHKYEHIHTEIYNKHEQKRLLGALKEATASISTMCANDCKVLDFGCGAGNLTKYLLQLGFDVCAADVSEKFLKLVKEKFDNDKLSTFNLNGVDLSGIEDNKYDFIATYSVLHHVPDYLGAISELVRVLKPGGVLYIDHERNENYWIRDHLLQEYNKANKWYVFMRKLPNLLKINYYKDRFKRFLDPRYRAEGDIHVFIDDHVEWDKIKQMLPELGAKVVNEVDYLLYDSKFNSRLFEEYKNSTSDMKLLVIKKEK